jgi:uroporphyrinogen-III decarboxylase
MVLAHGKYSDIALHVENIMNNLSSEGFVFNLGHGILPSTPCTNVDIVIDLIRSWVKKDSI